MRILGDQVNMVLANPVVGCPLLLWPRLELWELLAPMRGYSDPIRVRIETICDVYDLRRSRLAGEGPSITISQPSLSGFGSPLNDLGSYHFLC